jgi:hypothetical protein
MEAELAYAEKVNEVKARGNLKNFCAVCDTSGSMTWENAPIYDAVGIALLVAECSMIGPRIMTFASDPRWICFDADDSFVDKVRKIRQSELYTGSSTNLYKCMGLILSGAMKAKLTPSEISNLNLLIVSDMQVNAGLVGYSGCVDGGIGEMFSKAGYPDGPNLVYWNMRSTSGFPVGSFDKKGVILLSGYEVSTLQNLCQHGINGLKEMNPISSLVTLLANPRYRWFWN